MILGFITLVLIAAGFAAICMGLIVVALRLSNRHEASRNEQFIPLNEDVVDEVADVDASMLTALNKRDGITS